MVGSHPLEEMAVGDEDAYQGAADGIQHKPSLMGEERQGDGCMSGANKKVAEHSTQVVSLGNAVATRQQTGE